MIHTEVIVPIPELIRRHAQSRPDHCAWRDAAMSISYGDLAKQTAVLAVALADAGLAPGDRVALLLPNSVPWVVSCLALARAGLVAVPISFDAAHAEVDYRLRDSETRLVISTVEKIAALQAQGLPEGLMFMSVGAAAEGFSSYEEIVAKPATRAPRDPQDIDGVAYIVYTSGTTGRAKGVRLSARSMLWVVGACWIPIAGLNERDVVLSPLPLFHSYALNLSVLAILAVGATEYIMERYSTAEAMRLIGTGEFTLMPGVPTMFHYLLEGAQSDAAFQFNGLRLCISAGAIMQAELNRRFEERSGVTLVDGYGITETATMVTLNSPRSSRRPGYCGLPVPGVAVRILHPESRRDCGPEEEGELVVRGPNLMLGYHNKPEETDKAMGDGWYRTGDLAKADPNGFLVITGRLKELIIRGGQNIAPGEIEEAALKFPALLDCAAVGLPHAHLGEVPALFYVPRAGQSVDESALLEFLRGQISSYKVPATLASVETIPRTGSGKVMRFKLKEMI